MLKLRRWLRRAPLVSYIQDTQDGTILQLNGPKRSAVGQLKKDRTSGRLCLHLVDREGSFAPYAGIEIEDTPAAVRELQQQMSAHMMVTQ